MSTDSSRSAGAEAAQLWHREVDKALDGERAKRRELQQHLAEIETTSETLQTLPERIAYDVMVPFGRVAMFPGRLARTNEVYMHLGAETSVHTSAKHARAILGRRAQFVREQVDALDHNITALEARPALAAEGAADSSEPLREITEEYDEAVHGALDASMVSTGAAAQRRRFGPPRNDAEAAAIDADLRSLRKFTSTAATPASATTEAVEAPTAAVGAPGHDRWCLEDVAEAGTALQTAAAAANPADPFSGAPDSDDEDAPPRVQGLGSGAAISAAGAVHPAADAGEAQADVDGDALQDELRRLEAALDEPAGDHSEPGPSRPLVEALPSEAGPVSSHEAPTAAGAVPAGKRNDGGAALDRDRSGASTSGAAAAQRAPAKASGLQRGFLVAKPKPRGILKKPSAFPENPAPPATATPRASPALAAKAGPTEAEADAFSGRVVERSGGASASDASASVQASRKPAAAKEAARMSADDEEREMVSSAAPAKVSKFKARMMQAKQAQR